MGEAEPTLHHNQSNFVQVGSVFQGIKTPSKNGKIFANNGITCALIALTLSLNIFEKVRIVMKAGTAQGSKKITPKIRFPFTNGWFGNNSGQDTE